jgi:hypothetical protein
LVRIARVVRDLCESGAASDDAGIEQHENGEETDGARREGYSGAETELKEVEKVTAAVRIQADVIDWMRGSVAASGRRTC